MSKKDFIALANAIREHNQNPIPTAECAGIPFNESQINCLALFCEAQNPNFKRERWLNYIAGICGPNGGAIKS